MFELTIEDGKVYDFYEALSTCYDGYVPTHSLGSVPLVFPHAPKSYVEPKAEEKRPRRSKKVPCVSLRTLSASEATVPLQMKINVAWTDRSTLVSFLSLARFATYFNAAF